MICTDVAARGIDVSGLPFMINMGLPDDKSNYVHRIGRVGRAERMGLAISLVSTVKEKVFESISAMLHLNCSIITLEFRFGIMANGARAEERIATILG